MLLLVATAGCSFDSAPLALAGNGITQGPERGGDRASQAGAPAAPGGGASDGAAIQAGATGGGTSDGGALPPSVTPPATGPSGTDAATQPPADPPDAGGVSSVVDAAVPDAGSQPDAAPDAAAPTKGLLFDRCVSDDECSLGLVCYGSGPGHCAQPCAESSDCVDVDGFEFSCSTNDGACRIDCTDEGPDACPQGLVCVARIAGEERCMLPREDGTGERGLFEPCDLAQGDDECADGLVCYRSADSRIDGPGYCTLECGRGESSCDDVSFSSTAIECAASVCRFDCTEDECPLGMACERLGPRGLCHYPADRP